MVRSVAVTRVAARTRVAKSAGVMCASANPSSLKTRRSSGVRQWFSWYHRRYKRFSCETEVKTEEAEPGLLFEPKTEQERRDYERALREAGNN